MDLISELKGKVGEQVTLGGWVYNFRSSGAIYFLQLRDGSGFIQCIVEKAKVAEKIWQDCEKITLESSVQVFGQVSEHPKKPGVYELQVTDLKIVQIAAEYPIGKKEHGPDFLLDNRHLWLRSGKQWAIQRVRNTIINATYEYFAKNNFIKIDSPILTPNACEGTTELFELNYFDWTKAYLTQSGQLYLEAAIAAHGRVFDFGPVFRAEKSKTRRHLIEFWMMDAEMAFCDHEGNLKIQEELVTYIVKKVLADCKVELEMLERDIAPLEKVEAPFYRLAHADAIKKLRELGSDIKDDDDLGADDETILTKLYDKPLFVERYPAAVKAFYMKPDPGDPIRVLNADLLAPEGYGEVIGGSQREDDYDKLLVKIKEQGFNIEDWQWYLDSRKYGSVPHSGFGYGLERLVAWVCGLEHVRETIPFPRLINRIKP
ncbi:MAG: asparagine--tRNA ligase [Patescibacteria group bacterium]|jgi:asparaginyl-tRNA synthetase